MATAAAIATSLISTGGLAALVVTRFRSKQESVPISRQEMQTDIQKENGNGNE
jgi:hypothetical protein